MAASNSTAAKIISVIEITTINTHNEPLIHVEHFFDIQELKKVGLKLNKTLFFCRVRNFFNKP